MSDKEGFMKIKDLLVFYAVYLSLLVQIVFGVVAIDRNSFVRNAWGLILVVVVALAFPLVVVGVAGLKGSFAKWLRLIAFSFFKVKTFAIVSLILLFFLSFFFLVNFWGGFVGELLFIQIFLNGVLLNVVFIYFLGLVVFGRFQIKQPSAVLIRKRRGLEISVYQDGAIRHIPDPETFNLLGYSWDDVKEVDDAEFEAYKEERDIESVKTARLYRTQDKLEDVWIDLGDGTLRRVPNGHTLDFIQRSDRREVEIKTEEWLKKWKKGKPLVRIVMFR